jgi:hypothetical protein
LMNPNLPTGLAGIFSREQCGRAFHDAGESDQQSRIIKVQHLDSFLSLDTGCL